MCAGCAITAMSAAMGGRAYIASRRFPWLTPERMRRVTIALMALGLIVSTVTLHGSTGHHQAPQAPASVALR